VADSTLEMYRTALRLRRSESALGDGHMEWRDSALNVLAFTRPGDPAVTCVMNLSPTATQWPAETMLVASDARVTHSGGQVTLPPSSTAWLR
jgi:alpha-glucosidase